MIFGSGLSKDCRCHLVGPSHAAEIARVWGPGDPRLIRSAATITGNLYHRPSCMINGLPPTPAAGVFQHVRKRQKVMPA